MLAVHRIRLHSPITGDDNVAVSGDAPARGPGNRIIIISFAVGGKKQKKAFYDNNRREITHARIKI